MRISTITMTTIALVFGLTREAYAFLYSRAYWDAITSWNGCTYDGGGWVGTLVHFFYECANI